MKRKTLGGLLIGIYVLGLMTLAVPAEAQGAGGTWLTTAGNAITVHTRIGLIGPAATADMAQRIQQQIQDVWQSSGNAQSYCGMHVLFTVEVHPEASFPSLFSPPRHRMRLVTSPPGNPIRSNAGGAPGTGWVFQNQTPGTWDVRDMDTSRGRHMVAHETGHLYGADNGYMDAPPYPIDSMRERSLMGDVTTDVVDYFAIEDIMDAAADAGYQVPDCERWQGHVDLMAGRGTGCGVVVPFPGCSGTASLALDGVRRGHFRVYLQRKDNSVLGRNVGRNAVLGGSARLWWNWEADYVIDVPALSCRATLSQRGDGNFRGRAGLGFLPGVTFGGEVSWHGGSHVSGSCPVGPLGPDGGVLGSSFALEGFDGASEYGTCRVTGLDALVGMAQFTYSCTYRVLQVR